AIVAPFGVAVSLGVNGSAPGFDFAHDAEGRAIPRGPRVAELRRQGEAIDLVRRRKAGEIAERREEVDHLRHARRYAGLDAGGGDDEGDVRGFFEERDL